LEKRLSKKLIAPLTDIMNSTNAMSLLYECIQTCTIGLSAHVNVIRLCITKLRLFIEDPDQNRTVERAACRISHDCEAYTKLRVSLSLSLAVCIVVSNSQVPRSVGLVQHHAGSSEGRHRASRYGDLVLG